jgi:phage tail-like protein
MALLPDLLRLAGSPEGERALRNDPVLSRNFLVTLLDTSSVLATIGTAALSAVSDVLLGGFSECSGIEMQLAVDDYKEGGNNGAVLKFPGRVSWGNITLKRGVTQNTSLWDWHYGFVVGKGARRDGLIVLMNELHVPNNIWFFRRALPIKYIGPSLNAGQSAVAVEQLELAHEGIFQLPFVGAATGLADAIAGGSAAGLINAGGSAITQGINL